jgi:hypothetical protein
MHGYYVCQCAGNGARVESGAVVDRLAWRLRNFNRWLIMDARAEAPAPSKTSSYPAVEDLPPKREIMAADEQLKLKKELSAARDRQAASVKAQGAQRLLNP